MSTIAISVCFSLLSLILVNQYLFSWTGLLLNLIPSPKNPFLDVKSVGVRGSSHGKKRLSFIVELHKVRAAFFRNSACEIIYHSGHPTVFDGTLTIYRKMGRVWYFIYFDTRTRFEPTLERSMLMTDMGVGTRTPMHMWKRGEPSVEGERPYVPSFLITRRINRMIKDLPLTKKQKSEIRSNIKISYKTGLNLTFF